LYSRTNLLSKGGSTIAHSRTICRQKGIDATLGEKSLRWIVLKRTAIAGIFSLAAVNACFSQQMLPFHNKITTIFCIGNTP
ncbi:MAG: hypothetical protein IIV72_03295, partial [Alistipes sp.]|nr:hypothetical protein [Alistipes sp.]